MFLFCLHVYKMSKLFVECGAPKCTHSMFYLMVNDGFFYQNVYNIYISNDLIFFQYNLIFDLELKFGNAVCQTKFMPLLR